MARICPACERSYPDSIAFCGDDGVITIQEQDPNDVDSRLGQRLGDYLLVARIADGAMGRVYEARHHETKARCACKVLHADVAKDQVAVERFKREYEAAEEMDHEGIVKVIDFGTTGDGANFLTMEYLEGEELGELVRRDKKMPMARVLRVICQVCAALDYAHSFGFIHRDLKPDNIFLCKGESGDTVRILDFGSVKLQMETGPKLTAFGTTLGSPYYMSPEQAMGKPDVDQRSDVFAVAAILYEAITGKVAFDAGNVAQILMKIINETPPPASDLAPGTPAAVDAVIAKGLAKDKAQRFGSAGELADALCAALGLEGDHMQWANKPVEEIDAALASATPPEAMPLMSEAAAPAHSESASEAQAEAGASSERSHSGIPGMKRSGGGGWMIGLAVGAVAAAVLAFILMRG